MVSKITLFEVHLDDARFGLPSWGNEGEDADADSAREGADSSGSSRVRVMLLGGALLLVLLAAVAVRRRRAADREEELERTRGHADTEDHSTEERTVGAIE